MAVIDFFDRGWALNPQGAAYVSTTGTWTYEEAGRTTCRVANALLDAGATSDTKVAVLSPNDPLAWLCVLGTWRAGATWVPLNPDSPVEDSLTLLTRFHAEWLLYHSSMADAALAALAQVPTLRRIVCIDDDAAPDALATMLAAASDAKPHVAVQMDDVISIAPTGGTTGLPKGVMNTHRTFTTSFTNMMLGFPYTAGEHAVSLAAAPMTHSSGMYSMPVSARGGTVVVIPRAHADAILDAIEQHGVTELFLPPTVIYRILDRLEHRGADTSSLKYLIYSAAPMSTEKLRVAIDRLGPVMTEVYGQMEAPAGITYLSPHDHFVDGVLGGELHGDDVLASCGRPFPSVEVGVLDPESSQRVADGETGEICVRGDIVMRGYYDDPERTAETVIDGWLRTGDLGHVDAAGRIHLTDRRKDMIISGGFNVYPSEVEQVIWSHPAVQDCAVVGVPDPDWGERVTAVVELNEGQTATADEIVALCKERLGGVRTPKQVEFVDSLPRSVNGKVLKKDIRERFWSGHARRI
ncbi:class I adenylate-forming enzyme family protein [Agrococcus jejuensis]|uniref:Acyl-CoA synthetase (AMP-forming)/AMP-acid ligase II n=1 Tax=Agrococcus jejuensis TaxID=399736 RepID=A0A1G8A0B8_9MICO|nr:AMP-binding protein [Agrococcus jejuensis]SDH14349.1 Acyl-CoA synthetase (AMP-forming)/AMP-acid ligase II [Agrococcus jejuensis]